MAQETSEPTTTTDPLAANDFASQLIRELDDAPWPLPREHAPRRAALLGRAFRKSERDWLKNYCGWTNPGADRPYRVDNLARRISFGFADFLFADDLDIKAAEPDAPDVEDANPAPGQAAGEGTTSTEAAQEELDMIVEQARLLSILHRMERVIVSEGEAWWKLHVNRDVAEVPLLAFASRLGVVPLLYGDLVLAAAFVNDRKRAHIPVEAGSEDTKEVVYRHAEIHTNTRIINVLYLGDDEHLGERIPLTSIEETAGYNPEWRHGLPMLAGRIVNDLDDDPAIGVGELDGIQDQLLDLNEAVTIAAENARLTGKQRIFSAGRFMQADGSFDASMDVFQVEQEDATLGEGDKTPPVVVAEGKYDAGPLWQHIGELVKTALNRVGLVPQWVGENTQGSGVDSGVAIRLRFIPTTNAAKGKLREWQHALPHILDLQLRIISLPEADGGFGRPAAQDDPPSIEWGDPIPQDESKDLLMVAAAVDAEIMSRRRGIEVLNPEWAPDQIDAELQLIKDEQPAPAPVPPPPGFKAPEPPATAGRG